jgi:release factor glutamine methyltransferase
MQVKQGDLLSAFASGEYFEKIDLIICNPPYILSSNVAKMHPEIASNEPALAFDGGMLGIKIIQKLMHEAPRYLTTNGWLIFEVGAGQGDFIAKLCEKSGLFQNIEKVPDTSGTTRVIMVQTAR